MGIEKPPTFRKIEGELIKEIRKQVKKDVQYKLERRKEIIMNIYEQATAYIRTYSPMVAGAIIGLVAKWGLNLDDAQAPLTALLTVLGGAIYYALARWIGKKYPVVEKWLLGSSKTPDYK